MKESMSQTNSETHKLTAEFIGTMFLVFIGCGTAIAAPGLGALGLALAFGLALAITHYISAPISGGHLNPAISFTLWLGKKMSLREFLFYVIAQLLGATIGISLLYFIFTGKADFNHLFFSNGFAEASPNGFSFISCGVTEAVLTGFFILGFLSISGTKGSCAATSLMIGLTFSVAYFLAAPFTHGSLNPARSFAPAVFEGGMAIQQIWFFFVMPMAGSLIASSLHKLLGYK